MKIKKKDVTHDLVDKETGEVIPHYLSEDVEESFSKCYDKDDMLMMLTGMELKVLIQSVKYSSYSTTSKLGNRFKVDDRFVEYCGEHKLRLGKQTIKNAISRLSKEGYLVRCGSGEYMVNPLIFYKGRYNSRQTLIRMLNEGKSN